LFLINNNFFKGIRLLVGQLANGQWCWTTKKAYPCRDFPDATIFNKVYPTEIQKNFHKLDVLLLDKVFQTKYLKSEPKVIQGWKTPEQTSSSRIQESQALEAERSKKNRRYF